MQSLLFTKLFLGERIETVAEATADIGFEGIDLLIRPGFHADPKAPESVGPAVQTLQAAGLTVPMATTDITASEELPVERLFASCAQAGIGLIRLGYWHYHPSDKYTTTLDTARRNLDDLAAIAERTEVRLAVQLHGGTIHGSGLQTSALLANVDPGLVGAYVDPGNQVVQDGREDWQFTFEVLQPWLCCVGMKNGGWFPGKIADSGQRHWESDWMGLADGMVPWDDIVSFLSDSSYDGFLSFHSHYEVPLPQVLDQTRTDLNYIRRLFETARPTSV